MWWTRGPGMQAINILHGNDRGTYSVPTPGLYPVQFNWDSAFAALGYRLHDAERAFSEIILLLSAQWPDGLVPHIIFRGDHQGYFPGPEVWQAGGKPPTSGITQPPVAASALRRICQTPGYSASPARLTAALVRLEAWHEWFTRARQDDQGAIFIVHPWESGRDNLPDWESGLSRIEPNTGLGAYRRRDLDHVPAAQRPTEEEYDRYLTLIHYGRTLGWDQEELGRTSPFRLVCPGMTAMLLAAERDLLAMQADLNLSTDRTRARIDRLEAGWRSLWNPQARAFVSRDLVSGWVSQAVTSAAFLGPYAGVKDQLGPMMDHFDRLASRVRFLLPSFDPDCPGFDAVRYWRGPVWFVINNRVGLGLEAVGETARADRLRRDTRKLAETAGFYEYFDPLTGAGLGGKSFTWTASVYLDWANPKRKPTISGRPSHGTH